MIMWFGWCLVVVVGFIIIIINKNEFIIIVIVECSTSLQFNIITIHINGKIISTTAFTFSLL